MAKQILLAVARLVALGYSAGIKESVGNVGK